MKKEFEENIEKGRRKKNLDKTISDDKVAVKSGYYFEIFEKEKIPDTLKSQIKL